MNIVLKPAGLLVALCLIAALLWAVVSQRADSPFERTGASNGFTPMSNPPIAVLENSHNAPAIDLSRLGSTDWVIYGTHPGVTPAHSFARKAVALPAIAPVEFTGAGTVASYASDPRPFRWSDGAGDSKTGAEMRTGIVTTGVGSGFHFVVTPTVGRRQTLKLWVGGEGIRSKVFARFDDGAPLSRVVSSSQDIGPAGKVSFRSLYTVYFTAAKPSEKLIVSFIVGEDGVVRQGAAKPTVPAESAVSLQAVALD